MAILAACAMLSGAPVAIGSTKVTFTQADDFTVGEGVRASLTFSGFPLFDPIQWSRNGVILPGRTNLPLRIAKSSLSDAGVYTAFAASNEFRGPIERSLRLDVVPAFRLEPVAIITNARAGRAMWIKAANGLACVASGGLDVYDIADPERPVQLSTYGAFNSKINAVYLTNRLAFLADDTSFQIVDLSNPAQPVRLSRTSLGDSVGDIVVRGNLAFVGTFSSLKIFDVSNPASPAMLSENVKARIYTIALAGDIAYLAATSGGVLVVDISDPAQPIEIDKLAHPWADTVSVSGSRLYVGGTTLVVYDISDPRAPLLVSRPNRVTGIASKGMTVQGEFVFTGRAVSFSSPAEPRSFFSVMDAGDPMAIAEVGRYEYPSGLTGLDEVEGVESYPPYIFIAVGKRVEILKHLPAVSAPAVIAGIGSVLSVEGAGALLRAHASGGEQLSWQWFRHGSEIPGATNRWYTIGAVNQDTAGHYAVRAANSFGSVTNSGNLQIASEPPLNIRFSATLQPQVSLTLPEGFQAQLQSSSDLSAWEHVWSGQAGPLPITFWEAPAGADAPPRYSLRFYRLLFGNR